MHQAGMAVPVRFMCVYAAKDSWPITHRTKIHETVISFLCTFVVEYDLFVSVGTLII